MVQAVSNLTRPLEALFISTGVVALAEIGDKTQLLAFILAARFKKPLPIIAGILVATLVNHGLAGALGAWITSVVSPDIMRWILGGSFIGMAIWTLIPDKFAEEDAKLARRVVAAVASPDSKRTRPWYGGAPTAMARS